MANRDEFSRPAIETLAKRVSVRCSNPSCRKATAGPKEGPNGSVNIGVAAHITAAAKGGPRYDATLSREERSSIENAIWLCQNCAKLIDNDPDRYNTTLLNSWKGKAEESARLELEGTETNRDTQAIADLGLDWSNDRIQRERHDYRVKLSIHNKGPSILTGYHVDLEFPSAVIENVCGRVKNRSSADKSLFRFKWAGVEDSIFPGDEKVVFNFPYFMDHNLYWNRGDLFDRIVSATLYLPNKPPLTVERKFEELQEF